VLRNKPTIAMSSVLD